MRIRMEDERERNRYKQGKSSNNDREIEVGRSEILRNRIVKKQIEIEEEVSRIQRQGINEK